MAEDYGRKLLVLPYGDGTEDFTYQLCAASRRLEFAERFRRSGKRVSFAYVGAAAWGEAFKPLRCRLADSTSINWRSWYRDAEPLDLTAYEQLGSSQLPHGYWKWRILVEPAGIAGELYEVPNPAGVGGMSVMAEDLVTKEGVLSNLPNPFSAPNAHYNRRGNLQLGYTDDGGTTLYWTDPIWN